MKSTNIYITTKLEIEIGLNKMRVEETKLSTFVDLEERISKC